MRKTEIQLTEKVGDIQLRIGTFNFKEPKVFYISGSTWIECVENVAYEKALEWIETNMRKHLSKRLQEIDSLDSNYIFDFGLTANNMKKDVSKFFKFMIFLKQKGEIRSLERLKTLMNVTILQEIEQMINDFQECGFRLAKK